MSYKTHSKKNSGQRSLWCKDIPQTDRIGDKAIPEHEAIILNYILSTESIHVKFIWIERYYYYPLSAEKTD